MDGGLEDYPGSAARAALVILPAPDATEEQVAALASAVGGTVYEARLRLKEPLPRVVRIAPREEIEGTVAALRAARLEAQALDAEALLGELRPFPVRAMQPDGPAMRLSGPRGEVRIDLTRPALLVAGRLEPGRAGMPDTLFAHLYAGGWAEPLELVESDAGASEVLGAAKGPVRRVNFRAALELLRQQPGVAYDDRLVQHAGRIKECVVGDLFPPGPTERGAQVPTDLMSRVLHGLWRARLDERAAAAHDGALAVISTEPVARAGPSPVVVAPPQLVGRASRAAGLIQPPDPVDGGAGRWERLRLEERVPPPLVPRDPTRPLAPNVPGAPPITLVSRALALRVPHACVCCLAPPGRALLDVVAREERTAWGSVGAALASALGFGWFSVNFGKDAGELATRLRCPACDGCRRHELGREASRFVVGALAFVGLLVALGILGRVRPTPPLVAAIVACWSGALLLVRITAALVSRHGPGCPPHRAIRATCRGDEFEVVFGNRRFGERVAELNPDLVQELR